MGRVILVFVIFFLPSSVLVAQTKRYKLKRSQTFAVPEEVEETSGLAFWQGELLTHNDSGGSNQLYVLDTAGGDIKKRIAVPGALNRDWEALTISKGKLYIGDMGNNSARRKDLTIYITDLNNLSDGLPGLDSIRFHYPEQTNFEKQKRDHDFDCEAMVVYNDTVYLYSKAWRDGITRIRVLPAVPGDYATQEMGQFKAGGLVTDAVYNEEKQLLVLVGYNIETPIMQPFLWLFNTAHPGKINPANGTKINLEPAYSQIEGVTFISTGRLAITAEGLNNKWVDIAPALFLVNLEDLLKTK